MAVLTIKRFDKSLPLPKSHTKGAVGLDLYVRRDEQVGPGERKLLPANIAVKIPAGYFMFITPRSSTMGKYGLLVINGIVDEDYCGDGDEIQISVINLSKDTVVLEKGTRIAQGIVLKSPLIKIQESDKMANKSRGGFGTTGT